jgi:hypothetical protein
MEFSYHAKAGTIERAILARTPFRIPQQRIWERCKRKGSHSRHSVSPFRGRKLRQATSAHMQVGLKRVHFVAKTPGAVGDGFSKVRKEPILDWSQLAGELGGLQVIVDDEHGFAKVVSQLVDGSVLEGELGKKTLAADYDVGRYEEGLLAGVVDWRRLWLVLSAWRRRWRRVISCRMGVSHPGFGDSDRSDNQRKDKYRMQARINRIACLAHRGEATESHAGG